MTIEPFELLPQEVLDVLAGPVAMILVGKQDQSRRPTGAPHCLEEDLGLEGQSARVGVVVTVHDEDGLIDLVGEERRRGGDVDVSRLE